MLNKKTYYVNLAGLKELGVEDWVSLLKSV